MYRAILVSLLLLPQFGWAQEPADPARPVADLALSSPPELAADVLIKLAGLPSVTPRERRIEWLERAFALAPQAKFPVRLVGASPGGIPTDSDVGTVMAGLSAGLDTLSLQSRVVRAMLPLDRERAMGMFRGVGPLALPVGSCQSLMTANPAAYFEMVTAVYQRGFTPEERMEGRDSDLLRGVVGRMQSPLDLDQAARLMTLEGARFDVLLNVYVATLTQMNSDDRGFTSVSGALPRVFDGLTKAAKDRGLSPLPLLTAVRGFLVRHLSGTRCADNIGVTIPDFTGAGARQQADGGVQQFNAALATAGIAPGDVRPIFADEVKPARLVEGPKMFRYWLTPVSAKLLADLKQLRFGTPAQQAENNLKPRRADGMAQFLTDEQRSTPEWEAEVRGYLKQMEEWRSHHDEDSAAFFHMSAINYGALIELIPVPTLRSTVLRSYISFLAQSEMRLKSPPEWFSYVDRIVRTPRAETEEGKRWIRDELRASGDPSMALYLDLFALTPR